KRLFSRRSRTNSSRSEVVKPPSPRPSLRSACLTQLRMVQYEHPNSRESSTMLRPARANSTSWRWNSGRYRLPCFDLAMTEPSSVNYETSTEPGQDQFHSEDRQK